MRQIFYNAHQDNEGYTPLYKTIESGDLKAVKQLVGLGADLNIQAFDYEDTSLMMAVANEFMDIVKFLVDSGACLELEDTNNMTALDLAKELGDKKMHESRCRRWWSDVRFWSEKVGKGFPN